MIFQCNKRTTYQAVTTFLLIFLTYETLPTVYPTKVRVRLTKLSSLSEPFVPAKLYGCATITQYISQSLLGYKDVTILVLVTFSIKATVCN
jgi:hypothetical protein